MLRAERALGTRNLMEAATGTSMENLIVLEQPGENSDSLLLAYYRPQYIPSAGIDRQFALACFRTVKVSREALKGVKARLRSELRLLANHWQDADAQSRSRVAAELVPRLRALGTELRDLVTDEDVHAYIENLIGCGTDVLLITTNGSSVPWELLHFGKGGSCRFLAEGTFVARFPILAAERRPSSSGAPRVVGRMAVRPAVVADPKLLAARGSPLLGIALEGEYDIESPADFACLTKCLQARTLVAILAHLGEAQFAAPKPELAIKLGELNCTPGMCAIAGFEPASLVLLLACEAGAGGAELESGGEDLCRELAYGCGCTATGPLCDLPLDSAIEILSAVFRRLLKDDERIYEAWRGIPPEAGPFAHFFCFYGDWEARGTQEVGS
jgi:hypothetical protein